MPSVLWPHVQGLEARRKRFGGLRRRASVVQDVVHEKLGVQAQHLTGFATTGGRLYESQGG